ncbi:MAG: di-trans,poly-cis-decaprenylcistransferase [Chloroflexi bacterium]|nr:di-trans,poly-cis-decaprenylcistransferase [Chloroflexota bacterium]
MPRHVAIIMDGNGRWAKQRGLARLRGHEAGTENIRRVIRAFAQRGVPYLTLFAFSTENWRRPPSEVQGLFTILRRVIEREAENLHKDGVRLRHLGRLEGLSSGLQGAVRRALELTKDNTAITVNVAFNYGGRGEILDAVKHLLLAGVPPEQLDEGTFSRFLYTADLPDPDLIIRTAGELRLSNFLLWQSAYAEYYTTSALWPDFDEAHVGQALLAYAQRRRRFGGLSPQGPGGDAP